VTRLEKTRQCHACGCQSATWARAELTDNLPLGVDTKCVTTVATTDCSEIRQHAAFPEEGVESQITAGSSASDDRIAYDVRKHVKGAPAALAGKVLKKPLERLTRGKLITMAVPDMS
jgi:hypothetical protein